MRRRRAAFFREFYEFDKAFDHILIELAGEGGDAGVAARLGPDLDDHPRPPAHEPRTDHLPDRVRERDEEHLARRVLNRPTRAAGHFDVADALPARDVYDRYRVRIRNRSVADVRNAMFEIHRRVLDEVKLESEG